MKRKQVLATALTAVFAASAALTGFAKETPVKTSELATAGKTTINKPGVLPLTTSKVKFSIGVQQHAQVKDWDTNQQTEYLRKKTGLDFSFVVYPMNEMNTKLELAIAAGGKDLPDILLGNIGRDIYMPWAEAKMILPLKKYYDTDLFWSKESITDTKDYNIDKIKKYITSYDGEIYGMYGFNETQNNQYNQARLNIYQPWLDKLKLDMPKTTEDLYQFLKKVKSTDLNGNGVADEVAMSGYKDVLNSFRYFLMTPFVYTQANYWTVENGKIGVAFNTEGWREGLRYVRKLYKEGLIDPASFTQDQAALTATLSKKPELVGSYIRFSTTNMSADDSNRYKFTRLEQLTGPDGKTRTSVTPAIPNVSGFITKNCKEPELAFMFLDYLNSLEMSIITRYGFEGQDYSLNDEKAEEEKLNKFWASQPDNLLVKYYGVNAKPRVNKYNYSATSWGTLQNTWWAQVGPTTMSDKVGDYFTISGSVATEKDQLSYTNEFRARYMLEQAMKFRDDSLIVAGLVYNRNEQKTISDNYTEILSYVNEMWAAFVTGNQNIDDNGAWNTYLSNLEKLNLKKCVEATQACYDRMK